MKILFISHDATLTGAPILLLNLANALHDLHELSIKIIVKNNIGVLQKDFEKIGDVLYFNTPTQKKSGRLRNILPGSKTKKNNDKIQDWINEADIIFSNTITNGDILNYFHFPKSKVVISYVHELQIASEFYTNDADRKVVFEKTNIFCVPSRSVRHFLENTYGIDPGKIKTLNYYLPLNNEAVVRQTKKKMDVFIVGMIGTLDWRKGAELLSVILVNFFDKHPDADVQFLWKGSNKLSIEYKRIQYELEKTGHLDKVIFESPSRDVSAFYNTIDLLLLCSKEDPYPLVVLEAAGFQKPCICFDKAGGAPEFVRNDAGYTVPYLNINAVTDAIYSLYSDPANCITKGEIAYKRYLDENNNKLLVQAQFRELFTSINS
ncbi:MAG: glycosyltransferase family 4 protein [Bacteroidota bacterium]|nr:glycosyltransferase family 4 protein [Bacteroidota bacterium]